MKEMVSGKGDSEAGVVFVAGVFGGGIVMNVGQRRPVKIDGRLLIV